MPRIVVLSLLITITLAVSLNGQSAPKPFPVPRGSAVALLTAGDAATVQEAHRLVKEQGWIEASSTKEYVVVLFRSDRVNPLPRVTYENTSDLEMDIRTRSNAAMDKFHCYIFEVDNVTGANSSLPNGPVTASTLRRIAYESWPTATK